MMPIRLRYLALASLTTLLGLLVRLPHNGLPFWLTKYAGSGLWGVMVYWLVAACAPSHSRITRAGIAALIAIAVEFFRLVHTPWLDAFRLTLAGALLLGRVFSLWNIVAYFAGIALAFVLDWKFGRRN